MSTVSQPHVAVVDSEPTLHTLLDDITSLQTHRPSIFMDLEGVKLGRHGSISIVSLYLPPKDKVYLVDVHRLGRAAFSTANTSDTSLKTILESTAILKVVFDVRNDSDALYSHYQISLGGIVDLQLMELATRRGSRAWIAGLSKCIEHDSSVSSAVKAKWQRTKEAGSRLFNPEKGGRYEVFNERPLRPEIVRYCAQDVALLQGLHDVYKARLHPFWQVEVQNATKERVKLSQSATYEPQGGNRARGPWSEDHIEQATDAWNETLLENAFDA
ncbi:hypothetical protein LTR08_005939 [Meristemomyces frigidus]|nr:hypothetical protein LTR08_005939 [Meristemomyces frigidus]